jgi:antitoxin (DNA-binding transcriptional repressor) of toxin-antitoxin stability system
MNITSKTAINNIIPFKDFRINAEKYIKALEKGMSFVVVKRSKAIFRLEPIGESWETLVDFTDKGKTKGVNARKLLDHMEKYVR